MDDGAQEAYQEARRLALGVGIKITKESDGDRAESASGDDSDDVERPARALGAHRVVEFFRGPEGLTSLGVKVEEHRGHHSNDASARPLQTAKCLPLVGTDVAQT